MKLDTVEIIDFKSIKREKFSIGSNQLCFVGKNESGKSSLILATSFLNIVDTELSTSLLNKSSDTYPNGLPLVIGTFSLTEDDYKKLYLALKEQITKEELDKIRTTSTSCKLQVKRWGNGFDNISIKILDNDWGGLDISNTISLKAKFYDDFFINIYPEIQYFENEDLLIEPATVEELQGHDKRFETFRKLLVVGGCKDFNDLSNTNDINFVTNYLSDIEVSLNNAFKQHYKQDNSIAIKIVPARGDKLSLIIRDNSDKSFSIMERSPGFQYYFSFLVNKLHSKKVSKGRNTIILLDEPGHSLHPKGAKDLLISFNEISDSAQILYTTHNPFLAIRNCLDSLLFVSKSAKEGTKINLKPYLNKYQTLRKELGIMLNDSFLLGDINLVVEGSTEKLAFHRLFQRQEYEDLQWLNIYDAGGVTNIPQAVNYLGKNNLNLSGLTILDSDDEANKITNNKAYKKNISQKNWDELEINCVFSDKKDRTFEDLFPQDAYVAAFNKYCISLESLDVFEKPYEDYELNDKVEVPIINALSTHFKSFLSKDSKSTITKQDVIRELLDYVDDDSCEENEKSRILVNALKLCRKIQTKLNTIKKYVDN